ncbi:MAG: carbonic anhydrase, partial [Comamonadaceae bacterium]
GIRVGLADNWIRHIQDTRDRHHALLDSLAPEVRVDALVELNVAEQVVNVAVSTVMVDAWSRGQKVRIHGWTFGVHDGLLQDLGFDVDGSKPMEAQYRAAVQRIRYKWSKPKGAVDSATATAPALHPPAVIQPAAVQPTDD